MATITLKGNPLKTIGTLPGVGTHAPNFTITKTDLTEMQLSQNLGKRIILNIFPSLDTPTCATSVKRFNEIASHIRNTLILCVSADLPFAQKRFCGAENLNNVVTGSIFRHPEFGKKYGVTIVDGPLTGLLARAVVILDEKADVIYTQQVAELADEPDYDSALAILQK